MLLVFVEQISERLIYTFDLVFKSRGIDYKLTNDNFSFLESELPKFNYSERYIPNVKQLVPSTVLFDEEIIIYGIDVAKFNEQPCLTFNGIVDPLGSIFYVISRMEEYSATMEDDHGRYQGKNSILFKYNWLQQCIVDRWAESIINFLVVHGGITISPNEKETSFLLTIDIDNAFAFKLKNGWRKWLSVAKDLVYRQHQRIQQRNMVLRGNQKDPYDTYDYMQELSERGVELQVFWLLGDYAKFDKNISYKNSAQRRLINRVAEFASVGIHPSYRSNSYEYYLHVEIDRLEQILTREITRSRQHFLKMKLPTTYEHLLNNGIRHDYTMGYAEELGFRAGTARPFPWFDLTKNCTTELIIHPFAYMDGTLNEYLNYEPEVAMGEINKLFLEVEAFGGEFSCIWHNETIGNHGIWNGWKKVLEHTIDLGLKIKNR